MKMCHRGICTGVCSFSGFCHQSVQQVCKFYPPVQNFNIVTCVFARLEETSIFKPVARIEEKMLKNQHTTERSVEEHLTAFFNRKNLLYISTSDVISTNLSPDTKGSSSGPRLVRVFTITPQYKNANVVNYVLTQPVQYSILH